MTEGESCDLSLLPGLGEAKLWIAGLGASGDWRRLAEEGTRARGDRWGVILVTRALGRKVSVGGLSSSIISGTFGEKRDFERGVLGKPTAEAEGGFWVEGAAGMAAGAVVCRRNLLAPNSDWESKRGKT